MKPMRKPRGGLAHIEIVEELKQITMTKCGGNPIDMLTVIDLFVGNMIVLMSQGLQSASLLTAEQHKAHVDQFINMFFDKKEKAGRGPEA